jgi:hypothetical protein
LGGVQSLSALERSWLPPSRFLILEKTCYASDSGSGIMESNERYWARRAVEEQRAAARAVTPEARARRRALADAFARKAQVCENKAALDLVSS